jgi:hypothetical protein
MKVKNLNFLETWRETDGQVCFSSLISWCCRSGNSR